MDMLVIRNATHESPSSPPPPPVITPTIKPGRLVTVNERVAVGWLVVGGGVVMFTKYAEFGTPFFPERCLMVFSLNATLSSELCHKANWFNVSNHKNYPQSFLNLHYY